MGKLALFIKSRTQPGKREEVYRMWQQHLRPRAEANPAQERYLFCFDDEDPDLFYLFELYSSRDALAQAAQSPWFADYMNAVGPLLAGAPEVGQTTPRWSKGIPL